jgi:hypothetical protein
LATLHDKDFNGILADETLGEKCFVIVSLWKTNMEKLW